MDKKIQWESQHIDDFEDEHDDYDEEGRRPEEVITTPIGLFKINDKYNPYRQMEMWMGHTNFPITTEVFNVIDATLGVAAFKTITPYQFLISPGKLFEWRDVRTRLERSLCGSVAVETLLKDIVDTNVKAQVYEIYKKISQSKYWGLYVFPNGTCDSFSTSDELEYKDKLSFFKKCKELSNGILISNE